MNNTGHTPPTGQYRSTSASRWFWVAVAATALLGLVLRIPTLTRSLWLDETYSVWFASQSLPRLWFEVPGYEGHPPLNYTLLKGWMSVFGTTEVGLRGLSVTASVMTIVLVAVAGRILKAGSTGDRVALLAAFFLAFNSGSINYAQQARPYALQTLTASIAVLGAIMIVRMMITDRDPAGGGLRPLWPGIALLAVGAGLTLWFHNTGVFVAFGLWSGLALSLMFFIGGPVRDKLLAIVLPGLGALLIWSPYIPTYVRQLTGFSDTPFWIVFTWDDLLSAWLLIAGNIQSLCLIGCFGLLGVVLLWRRMRPLAVLLATILFLPWASMFLVSYFIKPIFLARLFEWMTPLVLGLAAFGILTGLAQPLARMAAVAAIVAFGASATYGYYRTPTEDWRGIIGLVAEQSRPGDLIIGDGSEISLPFAYYGGGGRALPDQLFVPGSFPVLDRGRHGLSATPKVVEEDRHVVRSALADHKRVWLVERRSDLFDPDGIVAAEIGLSHTPRQTLRQGEITVTLYE